MKKAILILITLVTIVGHSQSDNVPEALGLPGDNLNLYAVLDVFQKSKTLEDFESAINNEANTINNLDLNNDGKIDYIRVNSEKEDNSNLIILQVLIDGKENQDVAVIEVSRNKSGKIAIQVIGDEQLYGKDYIVEPNNKKISGTPNPGYSGEETTIINNTTNNYNTAINDRNFLEVSIWPLVQFIFSPVYVVYRSPYNWGHYPSYWRPWTPMYYHNYWSFNGHYYSNKHYHRTLFIRNNNYYNSYYTRRSNSVIVMNNRTNNVYRATYNSKEYRKPVAPSRLTTRTISSDYKAKHGTRFNNDNSNPRSTNRSTDNSSNVRALRPKIENNSNLRSTTRPSNNSKVRESRTGSSSRPVPTQTQNNQKGRR